MFPKHYNITVYVILSFHCIIHNLYITKHSIYFSRINKGVNREMYIWWNNGRGLLLSQMTKVDPSIRSLVTGQQMQSDQQEPGVPRRDLILCLSDATVSLSI